MVVRLGAAELVQHRQVLGEVVGDAVRELVLVDRTVGSALAAGTVVGNHHDDRVVQLLDFLEVFEQAADLIVGSATRKPAYTSAIRENSRCSSADRVSQGRVKSSGGNGSPPGPVRVSGVPIGLSGGRVVSSGTMPMLLLPRQRLLPHGLVPCVEPARVPIGPFAGRVVRSVCAPGA